MCGTAQTRHPEKLVLTSNDVLSLLHLAMDCHNMTHNHPSYTVLLLIQHYFKFYLFRVGTCFAIDTLYVRRLTAIVPTTYIRIPRQSARKTGPDELIGHVMVEQTPYFDVRDPAGYRCVLAGMLEDDDKVNKAHKNSRILIRVNHSNQESQQYCSV